MTYVTIAFMITAFLWLILHADWTKAPASEQTLDNLTLAIEAEISRQNALAAALTSPELDTDEAFIAEAERLLHQAREITTQVMESDQSPLSNSDVSNIYRKLEEAQSQVKLALNLIGSGTDI
ncbi:MAG: hypothetical protein IPP57_28220 [Candidatus Obscuribacter sp.]|jgi:hypothetical protein|nr:hypothetical protein [Candidatus Obscuribacter sp.]MBK9774666.1 hypothetical protein [Candidatus Obscuribacter sp.]MDQ5964263.1 hypothetical protein [Cyanobacteriota bacterium erpe_2018_sw_39hr_WHONDRS-SW48-000098_B_bin.30]